MTSYATVTNHAASAGQQQQQQQGHPPQQQQPHNNASMVPHESPLEGGPAAAVHLHHHPRHPHPHHQQQQQVTPSPTHDDAALLKCSNFDADSGGGMRHMQLDYDCDSSSLSDGREKADTTPENIKKMCDELGDDGEPPSAIGNTASTVDSPTTPPVCTCDSDDGASAALADVMHRRSHGDGGDGKTDLESLSQYHHNYHQFSHNNNNNNQQHQHHLGMENKSQGGESNNKAATKSSLVLSLSGSGGGGVTGGAGCDTLGLAAAIDESNAKICMGKPYAGAEKDSVDGSSENSSAAANNNNSSAAPPDDDSSRRSDSPAETPSASSRTQQSYAFTIDHFNDKDTDPATTAAKYKNMLERFQNRHRRGASLSKIESSAGECGAPDAANGATKMTSSASASVLTQRNTRQTGLQQQQQLEAADNAAAAKVKLRPRDRSTSRVRDSSKRHSWSPRSSTQDMQTPNADGGHHHPQQQQQQTTVKPPSAAGGRKVHASSAAAAAKGKPPTNPSLQTQSKGSTNLMANRTTFTPRSTAMQMALQKIDFLCPQPPLADLKHLSMSADEDNVSEAGTYTLDGDNYTEEQKDLMNIDRTARERKHQLQQQQHQLRLKRLKEAALADDEDEAVRRPLDPAPLPSPTTTKEAAKLPARSSNVLEVNYYHEEAAAESATTPPVPPASLMLGNHQSAGAYLEKIKSRVLQNMRKEPSPPPGAAADENPGAQLVAPPPPPHSPTAGGAASAAAKTPEEDVGCFTSVTTSGILAKQSALDPRPKLTRRCSLSTSQIDSSEYVSNETKLRNAAANGYAPVGGGFTDHQKAEYRLNVFTNQKQQAGTGGKTSSPRRNVSASPAVGGAEGKMSDAAVLKTAQTKNDWIQEWARNARARSLATDTPKSAGHGQHHRSHHKHRAIRGELELAGGGGGGGGDLMTRSYTCSLDTQGGGGGLEGPDSSLTDDSIYSKKCAAAAVASKLNKTLHRLSDNCDYASDPSLSTSGGYGAKDLVYKPPKSPSKIPSPLHSLGRARSASRSRPPLMQNMPQNGGGLDDDDDDDDGENGYLQKTAAAINTLQQSLSSRKSSLKSPTHSSSAAASPRHLAHAHSSRLYSPEEGSPQHSLESPPPGGYQRSPLHHMQRGEVSRRSHHHHHHGHGHGGHGGHYGSAAGGQLMTSSFNEQQLQLLTSGEYLARQMRVRKNSFDGKMGGGLDSPPVRRDKYLAGSGEADSPLRRSSSFSAKIAAAQQQQHQRPARPQFQNIYTPPAGRYSNAAGYTPHNGGGGVQGGIYAIKKSASSNNFRHMYADYEDNLQYYINDEDDDLGGCDLDCDDLECYSDEESYYHELGPEVGGSTATTTPTTNAAPAPLSNTRPNKALLMRIERSKQKVAGSEAPQGRGLKSSSASQARHLAALAADGGVMACPNTPEMPRRIVRSAPRGGAASSAARQSMPRDTSLNRLAQQVPNSLASAKKQLLQTAAAPVPAASTKRVQPKYLDISKYKPAQGNQFLRKNDAKSTLKAPAEAMKRSPSSSSMGLSRADPTRTSNRSVRSVASCMTSSATSLGSARASSAARRDASVTKQKEVEMAMWKRRSTYDPMRAAAEDRRRKEEAKRMAQYKGEGMPCESSRSPGSLQNTATSTSTAAVEPWSLEETVSTDGGDCEECI